MKYLIGQRVIINDREIGTITVAPDGVRTVEGYIWVYSPGYGHASCYSKSNIKPLPNGQL